jgi:hypothetical protein
MLRGSIHEDQWLRARDFGKRVAYLACLPLRRLEDILNWPD